MVPTGLRGRMYRNRHHFLNKQTKLAVDVRTGDDYESYCTTRSLKVPESGCIKGRRETYREESKREKNENDAGRNQEGSLDRTGGRSIDQLRELIWRSTMGFCSKSIRFEGGGRQIIGLNRTGKSCRLRWVNYLHPGLKRGKMTPQEERLVLELHARWGNRFEI
ncbi:hypothetical protein SADUNF_Sadunf09G0019200 [Salix dunnii]|uniref:HTH myb-type domain-containing protein n=1 Tax=Salix dunnii TaxID=1413687 RepID=A0A835JQ08_9ROSI|nr:hypothetical protein SADUNF_Sadunf09G0019200 [Salix dunnii]